MSYQYNRGPPMGRGYVQPGGGSYYPPQQGGGPPRQMQPGHSGYPSDYDAGPPVMRGGSGAAIRHDVDTSQRSGGFGRGYGGGGPHVVQPQVSPGYRPGNVSDYPRVRDMEPGSASGFESGSNSDPPQSASGVPRAFANDCEIVVLNKSQQQYGEMVEHELRKQGLQVDIMFPKGEVKVQEFLKPIAKLGAIFAVVIDVDNERSRTLNFYQFRGHTKPQYHKNVPLTMAYTLIVKKYSELKQKEVGIVPEGMKGLLSKLLNEESLKDSEYTAVVRFLQERRKRQNSFLNRTSNVVPEHKTDIESLFDTAEGKEVQKRILSLMNENVLLDS